MNSESSISALPRSAPSAPAELAPHRLAEVLAILAVDVIEALGVTDREVLERLANRLDDQGQTVGGQAAAAMLGAVGGAIMRLER